MGWAPACYSKTIVKYSKIDKMPKIYYKMDMSWLLSKKKPSSQTMIFDDLLASILPGNNYFFVQACQTPTSVYTEIRR
jgi:hypothetical protein